MSDGLDELPPGLKALLDAERPGTAASAAVKARLKARLDASLFPALPPSGGGGGGGAAAPAAGAAKVAGASAVGKLLVGVGVGAFAAGGLVGAQVHAVLAPPPPQVVVSPQVARAPEVAPVGGGALPSPEAPRVAPEPEPAAPRPRPKPAGGPGPLGDEALAQERSLIEQARVAMGRQAPALALQALAEHERRFPRGQLEEERLAMQALALSATGERDGAAAKARRFLERFPQSVLRGAVEPLAAP